MQWVPMEGTREHAGGLATSVPLLAFIPCGVASAQPILIKLHVAPSQEYETVLLTSLLPLPLLTSLKSYLLNAQLCFCSWLLELSRWHYIGILSS